MEGDVTEEKGQPNTNPPYKATQAIGLSLAMRQEARDTMELSSILKHFLRKSRVCVFACVHVYPCVHVHVCNLFGFGLDGHHVLSLMVCMMLCILSLLWICNLRAWTLTQ